MAMRGDDLIAFQSPTKSVPLQILKCETKSRHSLSTSVLGEAREALDDHRGRPAPHALSYVADRIRECGNVPLANIIDDAQFRDGIKREQITHLLFVFCGSNPSNLMKTNLEKYKGRIDQLYVGLRVEGHQEFIKDVYRKVISDANNR
jgi:hypothetical protein